MKEIEAKYFSIYNKGRAAGKASLIPDWSDAPEWANFLAMEQDGSWVWFEGRPHKTPILAGYWLYHQNQSGLRHERAEIKGWDKTLQPRPKEKISIEENRE